MYMLRLLGPPQLHTPSGPVKLERRPAAVSTYLALEGSTPKYKLAGMLWPESGETAARSNMRQLLRRMRVGGADIIEGEDFIELREEVSSDVAQLSALDLNKVLELGDTGELLEGYDYDDAPDFDEWLISVKEELREMHLRATDTEAERLEAEGEYAKALELTSTSLRLEPLSEEVHRRAMRLHYLLGDRAAALAAFERCKQVLADELGAQPLLETLKLAQEIEQGSSLPKAAKAPISVPLSMLRPPVLAGREAEWERLEAAWAAGQFIAIGSQGGLGKTRLMMDFVHSKVPSESVLYLQARPGDALIPYSSHARNFEKMIEQFQPTLEPWVRRELSRIIPKLADPNQALPSPVRTQEEKLRLYQAKFESILAAMKKGLRVLASDDVHYTDPQSGEAALYMMGLMAGSGGGLAAVYAYRIDELHPAIANVIEQGATAGLIAKIDLQPLSLEGMHAFLEGLGLPEAQTLAPGLFRYTGGNPLFALETMRHLHQTGQLGHGWPGRLPSTGRVKELTERRLQKLSKAALNLTQAAAVLQSDFTFELVCETVGHSPFEMTEAWQELEAAQIMSGERFSHDLLFEAVQQSTPEAVRRWLHRSAAAALERRETNPIRIAQHWLEGGDHQRATPWLLKAAAQSHQLGLFEDAIKVYRQAAQTAPEERQQLEAQVGLTYPLVALGKLSEAEATVQQVLAQTEDLRIRIKALDAFQTLTFWQGRVAEAEAATLEAQHLAQQIGDQGLWEEMRFSYGYMLTRMGRNPEAVEVLEPLLPLYRQRPLGFERLHLFSVLGVTYSGLGRFDEAKRLLRESLNGAKKIGSPTNQILAASDLQFTHNAEGTSAAGLAESLEALALGEYVVTELLRSNLAVAYLALHRDAEARPLLEWLTQHAQDPNLVCMGWARLGIANAHLGLEHTEALGNAIVRFNPNLGPPAQLVTVGAVLEYGTPEQVIWAKEQLSRFDPKQVYAHQQKELERLLQF